MPWYLPFFTDFQLSIIFSSELAALGSRRFPGYLLRTFPQAGDLHDALVFVLGLPHCPWCPSIRLLYGCSGSGRRTSCRSFGRTRTPRRPSRTSSSPCFHPRGLRCVFACACDRWFAVDSVAGGLLLLRQGFVGLVSARIQDAKSRYKHAWLLCRCGLMIMMMMVTFSSQSKLPESFRLRALLARLAQPPRTTSVVTSRHLR